MTCSIEDRSPELEQLCRDVVQGHIASSVRFLTRRGSFWTNDTDEPIVYGHDRREGTTTQTLRIRGDYRSLALIPLVVADENIGLLQLKCKKPDHFSESEIEFCERIARNLAIALVYQRSQAAVHERVKELTCLYGIAQISEEPALPLEDTLQRIVELLPPAWQYPEITCARITMDGHSYVTPDFKEVGQKQTAEIVVGRQNRGAVDVVYKERKPDLDEGPFLHEERNLIDTVARQVGLIVERRQSEEERIQLQDQLRHADRLATIGQLAAGVAHELNEPLGSILGFAQLAGKSPEVSGQTRNDIKKIESASLHAREVINKLMMFARQVPPKKVKVNLNQLVEEGLYFLESRCAKEGVELVRSVEPDLPEITADYAQLLQVLVNLAVNAIQAMPNGGRLTVGTSCTDDSVSLLVEDTGVGMSREVLKQIFMPFFTTKDVGQGTGLGLAVVHGIATSHGGSINVGSEPGRGSRFEVVFPIAQTEESGGT
jgi:signal transduction histidine kinase